MSHQRRNATSTPTLTPTPTPVLQTPVLDESLSANRELLDTTEPSFDDYDFDSVMAQINANVASLDALVGPTPEVDFDLEAILAELDGIGVAPELPAPDLGPVPPEMTEHAKGLGRFDLPVVPEGGMSPDNVRQGALGDCWLMSTLIAMSNHPRGREALMARLESHEGGHTVTVGDVDIEVDDQLPVDGLGRMVYGGRGSTEPAQWPGVFERAFATQRGGYPGIEGSTGGSRGAFEDLLPEDRTAESHSLDSTLDAEGREKAWTRLQLSEMATMSTPTHVYAVMSVDGDTVTLRDPNKPGTEESLIRMTRNEVFESAFQEVTIEQERRSEETYDDGEVIVWEQPGDRTRHDAPQ